MPSEDITNQPPKEPVQAIAKPAPGRASPGLSGADILSLLEGRFGPKIKAKNAAAIDPFVVVDASDLDDLCWFLQEDPRLNFDLLHCISGVDYLEPDPKKAAKSHKALIGTAIALGVIVGLVAVCASSYSDQQQIPTS